MGLPVIDLPYVQLRVNRDRLKTEDYGLGTLIFQNHVFRFFAFGTKKSPERNEKRQHFHWAAPMDPEMKRCVTS